MLVYWLIFCIPALLGMVEQNDIARRQRWSFIWVLTALLIMLIVGFRWKTGADWGNYYRDIDRIAIEDWSWDTHRDVGYGLVAWLASHLTNSGMILVTAFSGLLMGPGLVRFALAQPRPWLALTISVPYIIMVLGMGYMRQGMAVSLLMWGLVDLGRGNVIRYTIAALLAATFHSTAVIFVPLGVLITQRNRLLIAAALLPVAFLAFRALLSQRTDTFVSTYVDAQMESSGALVRLTMTALPAAVFLWWRRDFILNKIERTIWTLLAVPPLILLGYFFISPSSTVVDRLGLYMLPVQVFVGARIPDALSNGNPQLRRMLALGVILLYGVAHFVWLFFASHAFLWVPYRSWFFEDGLCFECKELLY